MIGQRKHWQQQQLQQQPPKLLSNGDVFDEGLNYYLRKSLKRIHWMTRLLSLEMKKKWKEIP